MVDPGISGFWGARTASVDWCEANYEHTRYICELFNTLSSGALVLAGVLGLVLHCRALERRFVVAFGALVVVGAGSAAFHATLRFELQMLDELPMIYLALVVVFTVLDMRPPRTRAKARARRWLPAALTAYGLVGTGVSAFTRGSGQFWCFQISFGCLEAFCLARLWMFSRRTENRAMQRLFRTGIVCYLVAIALWFLDVRFCPFFSVVVPALGLWNPQLHAVWHILVSAGFYCLLLFLALERFHSRGIAGDLLYCGGWLPYVTPRTSKTPSKRASPPT